MNKAKLVKTAARSVYQKALKHGADTDKFFDTIEAIQNECVYRYVVFMHNNYRNIDAAHYAGSDLFGYQFIPPEERKYKDIIKESLEDMLYWRHESPFSGLWPMYKRRFQHLDESIW